MGACLSAPKTGGGSRGRGRRRQPGGAWASASSSSSSSAVDSALRLVLPRLSAADAGAARLSCRRWRLALSADVQALTIPLAEAAAASSAAAAFADGGGGGVGGSRGGDPLSRAAVAFGGVRHVRLVRAGGWCDPLRARLELRPLVQARPAAVDLSALSAAFGGGAATGGGGAGMAAGGSGSSRRSTSSLRRRSSSSSSSAFEGRRLPLPTSLPLPPPPPPPRPPLRRLTVVDASFSRHPWPLSEVARRFPALTALDVSWPAALWAPGQLLHEWEALRGLFLAAEGGQHQQHQQQTPPPAAPPPPLPHLRSLALRKAAAAHLGHPALGDGAVAVIATAPGPLPNRLSSLTLESVCLGDSGVRCLALLPGLRHLALRGRLGASLLAVRDGLVGLTRLTSLDLGQLSPPEEEVRELVAAAAAGAVAAAASAAAATAPFPSSSSMSPRAGPVLASRPMLPLAPAPPPLLPRPSRSPLLLQQGASTPRSASSGDRGLDGSSSSNKGAGAGEGGGSGGDGDGRGGAAGAAVTQAHQQQQQQQQQPYQGGGGVLRFHSAFGRPPGAPSRALLVAATTAAAAAAGTTPQAQQRRWSDDQQQHQQQAPASAAAVLGADWSAVFAPLVLLRRLELHSDLALLGDLATLKSLPELADARLHAGSRFSRGEQRADARRRRQQQQQQQQQRSRRRRRQPSLDASGAESGTRSARAPAEALPPCWFDEGAEARAASAGVAGGAAAAAATATGLVLSAAPASATPRSPRLPPALPPCWRALTSLQIDGLAHADGFVWGATCQLGLRTLIVSGAMRTPRAAAAAAAAAAAPASPAARGGGGGVGGQPWLRPLSLSAPPQADQGEGSSLARLAALTQLRRLELRPSRRCAPGLRPTEAALSRLASELGQLTCLHLSLFYPSPHEEESNSASEASAAAAAWEEEHVVAWANGDGAGGGGGGGAAPFPPPRTGALRGGGGLITAFGRMRSLRHLSLELVADDDGDDEDGGGGGGGGSDEEAEEDDDGQHEQGEAMAAAAAADHHHQARPRRRAPAATALVDWRRLPSGLRSLSLARFADLVPDDWTRAAAACPGLAHLRLVGCGGGSRRGRGQRGRRRRNHGPNDDDDDDEDDADPAAVPLDAHAWRVAQAWPGLRTLVIKALAGAGAGGGGGGSQRQHERQERQRGLGSAGVAACARLTRLRALAITLEDGSVGASAAMGDPTPADVRPLAALAPTLEFLQLHHPRPFGHGSPPPGARAALRALSRLRCLAMPLLALHGDRSGGGGGHGGGGHGHGGGGGHAKGGHGDPTLAAAAAAVAAAAALASPGSRGGGGGGNALAALEAALPSCHMVDLAAAPWVGAHAGDARRWLAATRPEERDWWRVPASGEAPWEWRPTFCVLAG